MILKLLRTKHLPDRTLGKLEVEGKTFATLELPDKGNQKNISRIPEGRYECIPRWSRKFPYMHLLVLAVPDRSDILIHAGNTPKDTSGCILIGKGFSPTDGLTSSRKAVEELMELVKQEEEKIILEVKNV